MSVGKRLSELRSKLAPGSSDTRERPSRDDADDSAGRPGVRPVRKRTDARRETRRRPVKQSPAGRDSTEDKPAVADNPVATVVRELVALVREMLVIPAQAFMAVAEAAGAAVLWAWRHAALPFIALVVALATALYRLALRHVTPARAVAAVALVAVISLAASQWLDYRGVSVGTDAYSSDVALVAPAPDVERDRAGDAHAWVMLPIAAVALVALVLALRGRARAALLMVPAGASAILISAFIDAPKGLDEGATAIAYQGVEARLLEGFWVQIAAGSVLIACGLLLPLYLRARPEEAPAQRPKRSGPGPLRKLADRAGSARRAPKGRVEEARA